MSRATDEERATDRREARVARSRGILYKLGRIVDLYEEGKTDREISEALGGAGSGWSWKTVKRYRQVLQLALGRPSGGRWSSL